MVKKILAVLATATFALTLTACDPAETSFQQERAEIEREAALAKACQDAGGRYVLTVPPGYTSASYWCIWDSEKEGGEW